MAKMVIFGALVCALMVVSASSRATEDSKRSIDAPTPSDAVANVGTKVPPGAHGRSKRAATCGSQTTFRAIQAQESVIAHNTFRGKETSTNMLAMIWSDEMAAVAQAWANTCTWEHGMLYDCSGDRLGQNLFVESSSTSTTTAGYPVMNVTGVIDAWAAEKKDYNAATRTCAAGKMCGHYTQVVWARSREVGCAAAQCPSMNVGGEIWKNSLFVVCDYRNPGNVVGESMFIAGTSCTNCDSDVTGAGYKCVNKLCSKCTPATDSTCKCGTGVVCQNAGVFSTSTCTCTCAKGFYGAKCENKCTCEDLQPDDCSYWTDLCTDPDYTEYMVENCKKTCGYSCSLPPVCSA